MSVPQGGGLQGTRSWVIKTSRSIPNGVPFCTPTSTSGCAMCAACRWSRGTSVTIMASRLVGAIRSPRRSSTAMPDQFSPPMLPGKMMVPCSDGGVKMGPARSDAISARHWSRPSGVTPKASSAVIRAGTRRKGSAGNGWVGHACSPGTSLGGTGRSSTGKSGVPRTRSSRKTWPIFVPTATAGIARPPRRNVTRTGCAGTSSSHRSWCTTWNPHTKRPVEACSATTEFAQRLSPARAPP